MMATKKQKTRKLTADMARTRINTIGCPVCGKALVLVKKFEYDLFDGEPEYAGMYLKCPDSYVKDSTHTYWMGSFGKGLIREANIGKAIPIPSHIKSRRGVIPLNKISVTSLESLKRKK